MNISEKYNCVRNHVIGILSVELQQEISKINISHLATKITESIMAALEPKSTNET